MRNLSLIIILLAISFNCYADRLFIFNSPGYNAADPALIAAITAQGHTIVENTTTLTLPPGFTTSCNDPANGFDWLCFFGNADYTSLTTDIKNFIDAGGKVFYQYEVTCCTTSSFSVAAILASITGLPITENAHAYIAWSLSADAAYSGTIECCGTFEGNAYKGLDGVPVDNQLQADSTYPSASPAVDSCLNFGVTFSTTDFVGTANKGAFIGL